MQSVTKWFSIWSTANRYFQATTHSPLLSIVLDTDSVSISINDLSVARHTVPFHAVLMRTVLYCQEQMHLKSNTERALAGWNTFDFKSTSMTAAGARTLGVFPRALPLLSLLKAAPCKHPASLLGKG